MFSAEDGSACLDVKIRGNLEAQVVETQTEAKKIPFEFYSINSKYERKSFTSKKTKRPLTAFLIFMTDFFITYEEENKSINVLDVSKQGGEKWKSMSKEEKKVYQDQAAEMKAAYAKSMENNDEV